MAFFEKLEHILNETPDSLHTLVNEVAIIGGLLAVEEIFEITAMDADESIKTYEVIEFMNVLRDELERIKNDIDPE